MKNLISAIQFITVLPAGKKSEYHPTGMLPFYPVVGLIIGFLLCLFDFGAGHFWSDSVVAVLDVIFLIIVTGAFHLDGLADAADGLFSHRSREEQLEIMKDSRIGVMGLVAVLCGLGIKWGGISSLAGAGYERYVMLFIIPAYSRGAMLFGIRLLEYGRKEGTGHDQFSEPLEFFAFRWLALPVVISISLGIRGVWLNICFVLVVLFIIKVYKKKLGCITGDMLGAMTEATESLLFLLVAVQFL